MLSRLEQPFLWLAGASVAILSLFVIISAAQEVVLPAALLHSAEEVYTSSKPHLRCYQTANGCLDEETFSNMINSVFIPHVRKLRQDPIMKGKNPHAVLILNGSECVYHVPTLQALKKANIAVIVVPQYSSKLVFPLDISIFDDIRLMIPGEIRRMLDNEKKLKEKQGRDDTGNKKRDDDGDADADADADGDVDEDVDASAETSFLGLKDSEIQTDNFLNNDESKC